MRNCPGPVLHTPSPSHPLDGADSSHFSPSRSRRHSHARIFLPPELNPPLDARVVASSLPLLLIGICQYFVLRRWFFHAGLWIPTAAIAWLIAFLMLEALRYVRPGTLSSTLPLPPTGTGRGLPRGNPVDHDKSTHHISGETPTNGRLTTRWSRPGQPGSTSRYCVPIFT